MPRANRKVYLVHYRDRHGYHEVRAVLKSRLRAIKFIEEHVRALGGVVDDWEEDWMCYTRLPSDIPHWDVEWARFTIESHRIY
jgi:hypothetical protein